MPRCPSQENLYIQRINTVIGHIRENLNDDLSLEALARVAGFSPFHFHRIFKSITGETINEIVTRLRLERAVVLLRATPKLSITDAAFLSLPAQRLAYIRVYDSYRRFRQVVKAYYDLDVSVIDFPACQVAALRRCGDLRQEDRVIQYLFRYWLPRSRYPPANLPGMEIYRRQPIELGWETFDIDCAIPIVTL